MRPVLQGVLPEAHGGATEAESAPRWMTSDVAEGGVFEEKGLQKQSKEGVPLPPPGHWE